MKLRVESGVAANVVNEQVLAEQLQWLVYPENKFAILEDGERFVQAYLNEDGAYSIEYKDGDDEPIMQFEGGTLEQAQRVFQLFFKGGDYRGVVPFERFDF
ncbi:MAG: hypothetical protein M3020_03430 [Myxococcota bacterium]|nr:hypothetical protein [Myxococcota bacterium]